MPEHWHWIGNWPFFFFFFEGLNIFGSCGIFVAPPDSFPSLDWNTFHLSVERIHTTQDEGRVSGAETCACKLNVRQMKQTASCKCFSSSVEPCCSLLPNLELLTSQDILKPKKKEHIDEYFCLMFRFSVSLGSFCSWTEGVNTASARLLVTKETSAVPCELPWLLRGEDALGWSPGVCVLRGRGGVSTCWSGWCIALTGVKLLPAAVLPPVPPLLPPPAGGEGCPAPATPPAPPLPGSLWATTSKWGECKAELCVKPTFNENRNTPTSQKWKQKCVSAQQHQLGWEGTSSEKQHRTVLEWCTFALVTLFPWENSSICHSSGLIYSRKKTRTVCRSFLVVQSTFILWITSFPLVGIPNCSCTAWKWIRTECWKQKCAAQSSVVTLPRKHDANACNWTTKNRHAEHLT